MTGSLVVLLHLCDSLFPIGSFSHSDGLEAATSAGVVESSEDLRHWMDATLATTLSRAEAVGVCHAAEAFAAGRVTEVAAIDAELHAMRPSSSGREASRSMGARLLKTWQQIRPNAKLAVLIAEHPRLALPVAFGVVAASASIPVESAVEAFMYTRLAAIVSAAMRLMAIGQSDGHALLADQLAGVPAAANRIVSSASFLQSFAPMLDIAAMSQQYGHSRLFRS